jgi:hypothetical protein
VQGVPILTDTTSPQIPAEPPQRPPSGGATPWDGVDGQIKALAQQALATKTTIVQAQTRPEADPLPVIGMLVALMATVALAGWYLLKRLSANRLQNDEHFAQTTHMVDVSDTLQEPPSLAESANAAAPEPEPAPETQVHAMEQAEAIPSTPPAPDTVATSESGSPELSDPDAFMALALENGPPSVAQGGPDFSITLALAQESEALEMWSEARALALEVLQSPDTLLHPQALALQQRAKEKLEEIALDSKLMDIDL